MKFCWTRAYLLSVRCPIDCVEEERSTRGSCAPAVAQAQRKRLFEYFDYRGSAQASPVHLWSVIDPLRCAGRHAAPLDGGHSERRDERLLAMGRLSHACMPYTTLGVCRTTPLHHIVPLSCPYWDISRHRCYTLRQAGRVRAARHPSMHEAPAKEADDGYCHRPAISA